MAKIRSRKAEPTILSPEEREHHENLLAFQKELLQHVRAWIRHRGLKQRHVAEYIGVTPGQVSKWLSGSESMRLGILRQIAVLLKADVADLIAGPPGSTEARAVVELVDATEGLTPEQIAHLTQTARMLSTKPKP